MEKIAETDEIENLDPAVRRFLEAAWTPPSEQMETAGLRTRNPDFPDKRSIMAAAAVAMDHAFRAERDQEIVYDPHPAVDGFATWTFREAPTLRAYRLLMRAWNEGRDLGTCLTCGSLLLPGKGRIAKFCNDACRMQRNRRMTLQERIIEEPWLKGDDPEKRAKAREMRATRLKREREEEVQRRVQERMREQERGLKQEIEQEMEQETRAQDDRPAPKKPRSRRSPAREDE